MDPTKIVFVCLVVVFTLAGAVTDARTKKLPNVLTVTSFFLALIFHAVTGALEGGMAGMGSNLLRSLAGFATGFGILFVLWLIGGGGAGDVKMMGALGAWLGPSMTLNVFLVTAVFVVVSSVGFLASQVVLNGYSTVRKRFLSKPIVHNKSRDADKAAEQLLQQKVRRRLMPYGVPLALATWAVLFLWVVKSY